MSRNFAQVSVAIRKVSRLCKFGGHQPLSSVACPVQPDYSDEMKLRSPVLPHPWLLTGVRFTCEGCNYGAEEERKKRGPEAPALPSCRVSLREDHTFFQLRRRS